MILIAMSSGASACACGEFRGVVVAHGTSPNGVPWRIKESRLVGLNPAEPRKPYLMSNFSIGDPVDGSGYDFDMPLPVPHSFVCNALAGSYIDEYAESDLSGVTASRAVKLEVEMSDGQVLTVEPDLPPRSLRRRFGWLHGLRFFDVFFSASQKPKLVTAFDQIGRVLGRSNGRHGGFFVE